MSESLPITTPPRRRTVGHDHGGHAAAATATAAAAAAAHFGGDSCRNTPSLARKIEAYHHQHVLEGGSQSAKSSPLAHRRLDKLEGCIRESKPSPLTLRRRQEVSTAAANCGGGAERCECRPSTQLHNLMSACHQQLQQQQQQQHHKHQLIRQATADQMANTASHAHALPFDSPLLMRRRVDSDCSGYAGAGSGGCGGAPSHRVAPNSPQISRRQAVLGEPGCFSSPIHQPRRQPPCAASPLGYVGFGTRGRVTGDEAHAHAASLPSSVFASPARSISSVVSTIADCSADDADDIGGGGVDEMMAAAAAAATTPSTEMEQPLQATDQTVVSGWLKYRDNKRVCEF